MHRPGDIVRVERKGLAMKYSLNGIVFYTTTLSDSDQKDQIHPTNIPSDMDGNTNPQFNPNATVNDNGDGETVMTSSQSHQKAGQSSDKPDIKIDSTTIGTLHLINSDGTTDTGDIVKVGNDTVPVYRSSKDNGTGQPVKRTNWSRPPAKPYKIQP